LCSDVTWAKKYENQCSKQHDPASHVKRLVPSRQTLKYQKDRIIIICGRNNHDTLWENKIFDFTNDKFMLTYISGKELSSDKRRDYPSQCRKTRGDAD
jgi:hypothetical protein